MSASTIMVIFKPDTSKEVIEKHINDAEASGAIIKHRYETSLKGYAVEIPDNVVSTFSASLNNPEIDYVEADGEVSTQGKALLG